MHQGAVTVQMYHIHMSIRTFLFLWFPLLPFSISSILEKTGLRLLGRSHLFIFFSLCLIWKIKSTASFRRKDVTSQAAALSHCWFQPLVNHLVLSASASLFLFPFLFRKAVLKRPWQSANVENFLHEIGKPEGYEYQQNELLVYFVFLYYFDFFFLICFNCSPFTNSIQSSFIWNIRVIYFFRF